MLKKIITNILLAFVIFSIGYAAGQHLAIVGKDGGGGYSLPTANSSVTVYYLRSSFRCWQCNMIEVYAEELIKDEFSEELDSGLLRWQVIDYLQNRELSSRYNISGNTVIVARYEDGEEVSHERLDQVMEKVLVQDEFMIYIRDAIRKMLGKEQYTIKTAYKKGV